MSEPGADRPSSEGVSSGVVARNAFHLVVGQVVTTVLGVVLSAALGRKLGAEDFGVFYLISTMSAFAYVLAEWGQPLFVIRQVAIEPGRSGEMLGTALAMRAGLAVAVTAPAGLLAWGLGFGARTTGLFVLLIAGSLPLFLAQAYGMMFRASDRMGRDAALSVANKAFVLALTLPALAAGTGLPGVILAQGAAGAAALAIAVRMYRRTGAPALHVSSGAARELLRGGAPLFALALLTMLQPYLDAIVLSKLAPPVAVGWYGAAKNLLGTLMAPATILGAAAYPNIARASEDLDTLRNVVRGALRPMLWLGALASVGTYLFADAAIRLVYGAKGFDPAATILQVFAPGFLLLFMDILLGNVIYAAGRGTRFTIALVLKVAAATGLNFALVPWFQSRYGNGGIGIVVAFALSEFLVLAGAVTCLPRRTLKASIGFDVLRAVATGAVTVLPFHFLPPLPIWVGIPACVATFTLASFALGLANRRDLEMVRGLVQRRTAASASGP